MPSKKLQRDLGTVLDFQQQFNTAVSLISVVLPYSVSLAGTDSMYLSCHHRLKVWCRQRFRSGSATPYGRIAVDVLDHFDGKIIQIYKVQN